MLPFLLPVSQRLITITEGRRVFPKITEQLA
jgi:hypothetical protein